MTHKRVLLVFVAVAALTVIVGAGTAAGQSAPDCSQVSYQGDGSVENPYEVSNVDQLQCINEQGLDANYVQTSDIDASETSEWNGTKGFDPIGDGSGAFNGYFDGNQHNITHLVINRGSSGEEVGLFGEVNNAVINSAHLESVDVTGNVSVGALAGHLEQDVTVRSVSMNGTVSGGANTGDVVANTGGLIGVVEESRLTSTSASGTVNGSDDAGGIAGQNIGGVIVRSFSQATVKASSGRTSRAGGIAGGNFNGAVINQSYATGNIDGRKAGGITAENYNSSRVTNTYATGDITGTNSNSVGGVVGDNFESCPFREGSSRCDNFGGSTVDNSYWDTETTGQTSSDGGTGLTPSEMTGSAAASNMVGFDFTSRWETVMNPDDYPVLAWQTGGVPAPAYFEVTIDSTNSPVTEGENLTVTAKITNTGGKQDTQTVTGEIPGLSPPLNLSITLDGGESTTETRPTQTFTGDAGTYTVEVTSEDDTATTTVEVTSGAPGGGGGEITTPLPGFANPPRNIPTSEGGLDDNLVEDLDGDGEVTDITPTVKAFGKLIRGESLGLTPEQAGSLDWDEDNGDSVDIDDMVALFGKQIRAG